MKRCQEVYPQFKKVISITERHSDDGVKTAVMYKIKRRLTYYLIFRLDKKPKELFNVYFTNKNIEKKLRRKHIGF